MTVATERVEFRIPPELKQELESASALRGLTTSAFVKDAVVRAARETIREERQVQLDAGAWERFSAAVDRPGDFVEKFADLLRRPSVFSDE